MRPFKVQKINGQWSLEMRPRGRCPGWFQHGFPSAGAAIDFCYKNWPWWP